MRKIRCYECKKSYNYDEDAFCSHCGAFNQPAGIIKIDAAGNVIRTDGLNERNHGSFAHSEFHQEERERRKSGLDKSVQRIPHATTGNNTYQRQSQSQKKGETQPTAGAVIRWIIFGIIGVNILLNLFGT